MHVWKKIGIAAGLTAAAAVSIAVATPATADTAAQPGDAVGVGSDTLQNAADFAFDGAPGVAGAFNSFAASARVDNVFATGDANGRAVYDGTCGTPGATGIGTLCSNTNAGAPNPLAGSVILRAGTAPVIRPNGSGQGVGALIADSAGGTKYKSLPTGSIQFARMSRLPTTGTSSEEASCDTNTAGCGALRVFQAATDNLGVAHVASGFDGPAGLSAKQLYAIYTCTATTWNQVGGTSTAKIDPLIPQSGSGTRTFFLADLAAATGNGATFTPGDCVRPVQEHDPTGIYADPHPADAIEPFSQGKLTLINKGYFANGVAYMGTGADASFTSGAYTPGFLALESGTPSDGGANYNDPRGLYFVVRQVDATSKTPFQPGSTDNFVQALFSGSQSAIRSTAGKAEIAAAGFTPAYADCGTDPTSAADCQ